MTYIWGPPRRTTNRGSLPTSQPQHNLPLPQNLTIYGHISSSASTPMKIRLLSRALRNDRQGNFHI